MLFNQFFDFFFRNLVGSEGIHHDGNRIRYTDSIGQLNFALVGKAGSHDVLSHIAGSIGSTAVYLRGVLAGESAAAMTCPAAIGIYDNLAARETGVTLRAADNELARGVHEDTGFFLEQVSRHHRLDYMLNEILANLFQRHIFIMLGGYNNRVHSYRLAIFIDNRNLRLAVRTQIVQSAILAHFRQTACQSLRQRNRQRHKFRRFVGGITKHHALVTGTNGICFIELALAGFQSLVNPLCDIRGLFIQRYQNTTGLAVKAVSGIGITDFFHRVTNDFGNIHIAGRRDFTDHMYLTCSYQCFASYTPLRVLRDNRI